MIVREHSPENLEFPFGSLDGVITPNESYYVRSHFPSPIIDRESWRLRVEGDSVRTPLALSYSAIHELPVATVTATMECAGNGRVYTPTKHGGVQWANGAVGTAEWSGVWLRDLLERAGVQATARDVVLEGADRGKSDSEPRTPGEISYSRSLPIGKAGADVLLAHTMNGEALPLAHGYPLRAIVPGWYGMASVKWLTRICVTAQPFGGYFQTADYSYWEETGGLPPQMKPITEMEVKAQVARPEWREVIPVNSTFRIHGAAWSGEAAIATVEVSVDGGATWDPANLASRPVPHIWTLWDYTWRTPAHPGSTWVMVRATDERGRLQPATHSPHRGGYLINFITRVPVKLR